MRHPVSCLCGGSGYLEGLVCQTTTVLTKLPCSAPYCQEGISYIPHALCQGKGCTSCSDVTTHGVAGMVLCEACGGIPKEVGELECATCRGTGLKLAVCGLCAGTGSQWGALTTETKNRPTRIPCQATHTKDEKILQDNKGHWEGTEGK